MATRVPSQANLWQFHGDLQAPLIWCSSREICNEHKDMASTDHNSFFPPLINCSCPSQAAEPSYRTVTRRHCWLLSCVDVGNGYHFSQTTHCKLKQAQNPFVFPQNNHTSSSNSSASPSVSSEINLVMAHIQRCMRSRRGGSRGGSIRPPATPNLESASPSPSPSNTHSHGTFFSKYPDTRNGRGRSQLQGDCRTNATVHTANFPLPPHPSPHMTQFRFHSSLPRPVITATVAITFTEEIEPQEAQTGNNGEQQRAAQQNRNA